jgi:response regulator RpfG family c-di-GMP phosphodiesterase
VHQHIHDLAGTHFDPQVVEVFLQLPEKIFKPAQMPQSYQTRPIDPDREDYVL